MYIIIVGGGEVGYYLAKTLLRDGHEVLIVERNTDKCKLISEQLDDIVVHGDGCEAATLADIGTNRADVLIAVTGDDEDNLVSCQVAKFKFNVQRTIARVKNPNNESLFRSLGVDVTVSSTNLILANVKWELPANDLCSLLTMSASPLKAVCARTSAKSPAIGIRLDSVILPPDTLICLVTSKGQDPRIPTPDTVLAVDDEIIAITSTASEAVLRNILLGSSNKESYG